jgi:hypothetical protein
MAKYRENITSNAEPVTASTASLQASAESSARASRASAEASTTMIKSLQQAAELYVDYDVNQTVKQAEELGTEFLKKGKAQESLAKVEADRAAVEKKTAMSIFQDEGQTPSLSDNTAELLAGYDSEISRLKEAAQGGMSNKQYVARVDDLTRQAIAKYPGLADKIRERVGVVTGLPYADRWAQMQYVQDRFSAEKQAKQTSPEELALKDIDMVAPLGTFGTREELYNLYKTDRAGYDQRMRGAKEHFASKTQTGAIQTNVAGLREQSDLQADQQRASFAAIFAGSLGSTVTSQLVQDKEKVFQTTLDLMAKGEDVSVNPTAFKVQIDMHAAQMRSNIEASRRAAYASIDTYRANNPNISDGKVKELYADVDRAADVMTKQYADDKGIGLVAMAAINSAYRDKRLTEKTQLVDLAIKQQSAMQNNPMVMAYWAGGESRENLKRTNKDFYAFMENQERQLTSSVIGVRNDIQAATQLSNVTRVLNAAGKAPDAIKPDEEMDAPTQRAAYEALMASATSVLTKAQKTGTLQGTETNTIGAAMATAVEVGSSSQLLARDYQSIGKKIANLNEADQGVIKTVVSNSVATSVTSVTAIKNYIEEKYGVKFTLNIDPTGVVTVKRMTPAAGQMPNDPEIAKYNRAAAEFIGQTKPMLSNMVYARSMLTGEPAQAVGADLAKYMQESKPYDGFYKPTTVEPAGTGATSNATQWWKQ